LTACVLRLRRWHRRWGATDEEVDRPLPGDDLVPRPMYETTRAIAIRAAPAAVWPWLLQLGQGRGGFYTFDRLENLAGLHIHSVDRIVPALQRLAVGDVVPLSSHGGPTVATLDPGRTLVLRMMMDPLTGRPLAGSDAGDRWLEWTWAFVLQPSDDAATRLLIRTRAAYAPQRLLAPLVAGVVEPAHFVMEWGMLGGIKRRAESTAAALPARGGRPGDTPWGSRRTSRRSWRSP